MGFRNLESLVLSRTRISDAGLASLVSLPKLYMLDLNETRATDAGVKQVARLPRLKILYLYGTDVTAEGIAALKEKNPTMEINH